MFHPSPGPVVEEREARRADAIRNHAYAYATARGAQQGGADRLARFVVAEDVGFEDNIVLGSIDSGNQRSKKAFPGAKQFDAVPAVKRYRDQ